jgi:carboxylesterase type B
VPYARVNGRFRPAAPLPASDLTFSADRFGTVCPRPGGDTDGLPGSEEDCLNANVYRPQAKNEDHRKTTREQKKLVPVVVYVHGGAFNFGKGSERNIASFVAHSTDPIVGVDFNYRLGPLGFLPSSLTARAGILNVGLRDQQAALEWVRRNVAAFGGDPDNITLMGLSAGAHSVSVSTFVLPCMCTEVYAYMWNFSFPQIPMEWTLGSACALLSFSCTSLPVSVGTAADREKRKDWPPHHVVLPDDGPLQEVHS